MDQPLAVQIQNDQEHLRVLRAEKETVSSDLAQLLTEREETAGALASLFAEIEDTQVELARVRKLVASSVADKYRHEQAMAARENEVIRKEQEANRVIADAHRFASISLGHVQQNEAKVAEIQEGIKVAQPAMEITEDRLAELKAMALEIETKLGQRSSDISEEIATKQSTLIELEKQARASVQILATLMEEVEIARKHADDPQKFLAERELEVLRKERNIRVIIKRLQNAHKKLFPDEILTI